MKSKVLCIGLSLCVLSGCTSNSSPTSNSNVGIYDWMFSDYLTIKQATEKLGQPYENKTDESDVIQCVWNDYQLYDGCDGTLILNYNESETDYFSTDEDRCDYEWQWTMNNCNQTEYKTIIDALTKYSINTKSVETDIECYNFLTDVVDKNYVSELYTPNFIIMTGYHTDNTLNVKWGKERVDPEHF